MPAAFVLDESPLDSPFHVLDGDGSLAISGRDILVELDGIHRTTGEPMTFYFGSRAYNHPSAPDYYWPRLLQPLNFRRDIYSAATTGGAGRVSYGEIRLINNDGGLDYLADYALSGQRVRMLIGEAGNALSDPGEDYSTFEELVVAKVQRPLFGANAGGDSNNAESNALVLQIYDRLQDLAVAIQPNKYAGTNVLPNGLEGVDSEDIKDRPKPLLFGLVLNITPPCVNTARLIYQPNDGPIVVAFVYDNGAFLTLQADYTDQADMEANAPTAGSFRVWPAGGYFRLGAEPAGTITCTLADTSFAPDVTAAQVAVRIATHTPETGLGGVDSIDIDFDDVADIDAANAARVGIFLNGGETFGAALDAILGSIGVWYGFDRFGMFRMQRLELPIAPYDVTFRVGSRDEPMALGDFNIVAYRFVPSNDPERGLPTYRVSLEHSRNYTVQPPSVTAGIVLQDRKNFLAAETRTEAFPADGEDFPVQDTWPLATEKKVSTLIVDQIDAPIEAERLYDIYSEPRTFLEIDTILRSDIIALVDLGSVVNIVIPRLGFDEGQIMRVIGMQYNAANGLLTLALWG